MTRRTVTTEGRTRACGSVARVGSSHDASPRGAPERSPGRLAPPRARAAAVYAAALAWLLAVAVDGHAQSPASRKMAAEALFERGVALMKNGELAEGCAQLEQSLAIEHGIGAMLYLAECYERLGRVASAWALFRDAASAARAEGQPARAEQGADRANKLEPRLPKLRLGVAEGNAMPGFTIELNGVSLPRSAWSESFPVDPGDNQIAARAPGYAPFQHVERVESEAARVTVAVPALEPDQRPSARADTLAPSTVASAARARAPASSRRDEPSPLATWQRPTGLVVGGIGIVALGLGSYFGLRAISKDSESDERCSSARACSDASGVELAEQANSAARWSNGLLLGGLALTATGALLYLSAPRGAEPALALGGDAQSLRVSVGGSL